MSQLERFQSDKKLAAPKNRAWVQQYLVAGSNYPITLEIDATNKCPLDCPHCIWKDFRERVNSLQPEALLRVVREAKDIGVRSIHWTGGGDPLAHPTILQAVQLATSLGIKSGMFTSAVAMTPKVAEVLLANLSWVRVHVDGATRESYAIAHRVVGQVFDRVVENLAYFTKRRSETGSQISIGIGTVALEFNLSEAPALAGLS